MDDVGFDFEALTKALTDNFNILADEVQLLSDRKTILEHKLRFAHEQFQHLADKYATGDSEISITLAKLQLPPDLQISTPERAGFVPLPLRGQNQSKHQTAVVIRDGRRAAQRIAALAGRSTRSTTSGRSISGSSSNLRFSARKSSLSTVLEQDFTIPGKKGSLLCPFTKPANNKANMDNRASQGSGTLESDRPLTPSDNNDATPHRSSDPICAAMYAETTSSAPPSANDSHTAKCPIRYLDQHSPEEVARYFETHKHEIPRSHEICVKRYQRNEDDIRKLDAKYGNLVSMIQGLGQKHQPMLPFNEEEVVDEEGERISNERVENWAHDVSAEGESEVIPPASGVEDLEDRESRFDRPLKEIRVGESPSRPWGISVPIVDQPSDERPASPPPAPVSAPHLSNTGGRCPFGFDRLADGEQKTASLQVDEKFSERCSVSLGQEVRAEEKPPSPHAQERPAGTCPFGHGAKVDKTSKPETPPPQVIKSQPVFIQHSELAKANSGGPTMIFTGPVFIGYPIEQAMTFMQQFSNSTQ